MLQCEEEMGELGIYRDKKDALGVKVHELREIIYL